MRILVVDDDRSHGESLLDLLQSRGHEALHAQTPEDAGWLLGLLRFDAALIDHDLGASSGVELAARLAQTVPDIRCVLVSARPRSELAAGSLPFLQKPLALEAVVSLLGDLEREKAGTRVIIRAEFPLIRARRGNPPR